MFIYLICPVRDCNFDTNRRLQGYVQTLEKQGHIVHYPPRDCDQTDDGIGLKICETHREAMKKADEVHVWWNKESKGSHFDLGMAFALNKSIVIANDLQKTKNKSYGNVIIALQEKRYEMANR